MRKDNSTDCDADDVIVKKKAKEFIYVSMGDEAAKKVASYHVDGSSNSLFDVAKGDQNVDSLQTGFFPNEICLYNLSCKLNLNVF